jgi:hypothetical protein
MIVILETKVGLQVARILFKSNIHVSVEKAVFYDLLPDPRPPAGNIFTTSFL